MIHVHVVLARSIRNVTVLRLNFNKKYGADSWSAKESAPHKTKAAIEKFSIAAFVLELSRIMQLPDYRQ